MSPEVTTNVPDLCSNNTRWIPTCHSMFFWEPLKTVFFTGRRFFNFDFFCTVQTFVWIHGNYSVVKVSKSKKEKKIPFSVKINNRDFLNHVVVPNVRFVLRTVSTVLYCRTVGICTVHIRILYSTVNTSIYEYILYCIALYLCQGNDHIFRPCFLQYNILHCTLYSVLYTWGPVLWSRHRNQLKMKLHCFKWLKFHFCELENSCLFAQNF